MLSGYNPKSCNALEKTFYSPLEAAIRWCGLIEHEASIMQPMQVSARQIPAATDFPQWPCLRANTEKIVDAIESGEIRCGRDGLDVRPGEHVAPARRTVRHAALKEWMAKHYPDQKPPFLFDEIERSAHSAINADTFRALQADRDAARAEIERARAWGEETLEKMAGIRSELDAACGERDSLRAIVEQQTVPAARAETTYLNIIGALVALMLDKTPAGKPCSAFDSQDAIINALVVRNPGVQGIAERTLQGRFAAAKRSISGTG